MQRVFLVIAAAVIGGVAIFLSIQELGEKPGVRQVEEQQEAVGGARTVIVRIQDTKYVPDQVSIRAGQTVRWVNNDQIEHTVTGDDFDSGEIAPGESYDRIFADKGEEKYMCTIHPDRMQGTVTIVGD